MEQETAEQAISHIRLTFPKRIFEVCHLIKRETEADFFAPDAEGNFTKHIHISRPDTDQVCISLAVDNLTFEANNLCFSVSHVEAKEPESLESILETTTQSVKVKVPDIDPSSLLEQALGDPALKENTVKPKKRGRPRKVITIGPTARSTSKDHDKSDSIAAEDTYLLAPSGRRIRKPARYRADYHDTDNVVDAEVPDLEGTTTVGDEGDGYDSDKEHDYDMEADDMDGEDGDENEAETSVEDDSKNKRRMRRRMNTSKEKSGTSDTPVKVKRGRPPKPRDPAKIAEELANKKPHASRGKKRPHYKREANLECRICKGMYKDELSLIAHLTKLHPEDPTIPDYIAELKIQAKVSCKICGKVLGNRRNEMTSHMKRVHGEDDDFISRCEECGMEFKRSFLLKEHIRRQHPKHDRVLCHLCPATFKLKEYLTEHLKYTHNKQYKWQCDICHKLTSSPKNLRRHKKLHEEATFSCPICSKMFSEAGNMRRHIMYVHNSSEIIRHGFPHCERDFTTKNNLITHINTFHMKMTSFYCDICKKYFPRKKQLIDHATLIHPGVPILSTKLNDDELDPQGAVIDTQSLTQIAVGDETQGGLTQDQVYAAAASGAAVSAEQTTIFIQSADGTEHMLVGQLGDGAIQGTVQGEAVQGGADNINQSVQNIAMLSGEGDEAAHYDPVTSHPSVAGSIGSAIVTSAAGVSDNNLTIAQQALAAFEAGGGLQAAFGAEQYLSVIGEDGQEIRVQIVRKETDEELPQHQLEGMYIAGASVTDVNQPNVGTDPHNEETELEEGQAVDPQHVMATEALTEAQPEESEPEPDVITDH